MTKMSQFCPICGVSVHPSQRYPLYVCNACQNRAQSADGRPLVFYNAEFAGGYLAKFADTDEESPSHECYIDGIPCRADEARFGGIVVQPLQSNTNSTGQ